MPPMRFKLFEICNVPLDTTPPVVGWVDCVQRDTNSIEISWGAFHDDESKIDHYEVAVGTSPGHMNIASPSNTGKALSYVLMDVTGLPQLQQYFCSVTCVNSERLASGLVSRRKRWQADPLQAIDLRVMRPTDGVFVGLYCDSNLDPVTGLCNGYAQQVYVGSSSELSFAFRLGNTNPSINVSQAQWAICGDVTCTLPDSIAMPWTDAGRSSQFAGQDRSYPVVATTFDATMLHGQVYYAIASLYTTAGLLGYSLPSPPIMCDLTPPFSDAATVNDGPVPGVDIAYSPYVDRASGSWDGFDEDVSFVDSYEWGLLDEFGGYLVAPTNVGAGLRGSANVPLVHGATYYSEVSAINAAGLYSAPVRSSGFTVDSTAPLVWPRAAAILPWLADDWMLTIASQGECAAARAAARNATLSCPTREVTFSPDSVSALGAAAGYAPSAASVMLLPARNASLNTEAAVNFSVTKWGSEIDSFLASPAWLPRIVNGEPAGDDESGLFSVRVRWACGDPDSFTQPSFGVGRVELAVGTCPRCSDALPFTAASDAVHPYDAPAESWLAPEAYTDPGVYRVVRFGAYGDALARVPAANMSGRTLFVSVRCVNGAGTFRVVTAKPSVLYDPLPPALPFDNLLLSGLLQGSSPNAPFTSNWTDFNVSWAGAVVPGASGLADGLHRATATAFSVVLGYAPGAADISPARDFSAAVNGTYYSRLSLQHNMNVYATLCAASTAVPPVVGCYTADPVLVDLTPPVIVRSSDGSPNATGPSGRAWAYNSQGDVAFQSTASGGYANWVGDDAESGIDYWVHETLDASTNKTIAAALVTGHSVAVVRPYTVELTHGARVTNVVTAYNRAGLRANASSSGATIDLTAPYFTQTTYAGVAGTAAATVMQQLDAGSLGTLVNSTWVPNDAGAFAIPVIGATSPWFAFTWGVDDDLSPVPECWWQLGTYGGGNDILTWETVQGARSVNASAADLGLLSGAIYYPSMQCSNAAGLLAELRGPPASIDFAAPYLGRVWNGLDPDFDSPFSSSATTASVSFSNLIDLHTAVNSCQVAAGTGARGSSDLSGWVPLADLSARNATLTGLTIEPAVRVFMSVRCDDIAGNVVVVSTNGFVRDVTAPEVSPDASAGVKAGVMHAFNATTGAVDLSVPDMLFTASASELGARFLLSDDESGINAFWVAVATTSSTSAEPDVMPFALSGPLPYVLITGLNLTEGATYFVIVRAVNGAGLESTFASPGITVDTTPPICDFVRTVLPASLSPRSASDASAVAALAQLVTISTAPASAPLALAFRCYDPQSGVTEAAFGVGFSASDLSVVPLTPVTVPAPSSAPAEGGSPIGAILAPASLLDALVPQSDLRAYVATLLVKNGAGLPTVAYSSAIARDSSPPVLSDGAGDLVDLDGSGASLQAASVAPVTLRGAFNFRDSQSGVASVSAAFGFFRGSALTGLGYSLLGASAAPAFTASSASNRSDPSANALFAAARAAPKWSPVTLGSSVPIAVVSGTASVVVPLDVAAAANKTQAGVMPYTFFLLLNVTNGVGQSALYRTAGVVIDRTPPVCSPVAQKGGSALYVLDGLGTRTLEPNLLMPSSDVDITPNGPALFGRWSCADPESGIGAVSVGADSGTVSYKIVTTLRNATAKVNATAVNSTERVVSWAPIAATVRALNGPASSGSTLGVPSSSFGALLRFSVQASSRAGLSTTVASDGVVMDPVIPSISSAYVLTPLVAGRFFVAAAATTGGAAATASGVTYRVGPIVATASGPPSITYSLGSSAGSANFAGPRNLTAAQAAAALNVSGTGANLTLPLSQFSPGVPVFLTLTVTSPAGRATASTLPPVVYVSQAPTAGFAAVSSVALPSTRQSQSGYPSSVSGAQVTVSFGGWGDAAAGIANFSAALVLIPGQSASAAGFVSPASSAFPGASLASFCGVLGTNASLCATRLPSGCAGYVLQAWSVVPLGSSASFSTPPALLCGGGAIVVAALRAQSYAGLTSTTVVTAPFKLTFGTLTAGVVGHGPVAGSFAASDRIGNTLSSWSAGFLESTAGAVVTYSVGYGLSPGSAELSRGWQVIKPGGVAATSSSPAVQHSMILSSPPPDGSVVFATFVARNFASGLNASSSSAGIIVDTTPPVLGIVSVITLNAVTGQAWALDVSAADAKGIAYEGAGTVAVAFSCADPHTDISSAVLSVGSSPGASDVAGPLRLSGAAARGGGAPANLSIAVYDGAQLWATVVCSNGINVTTMRTSVPTLIDSSPPVAEEFPGGLLAPSAANKGIAIGTPQTAAASALGTLFPSALASLGTANSTSQATQQWAGGASFLVAINLVDRHSGTADNTVCVGSSDVLPDDVVSCTSIGTAASAIVFSPQADTSKTTGSPACSGPAAAACLVASSPFLHGQLMTVTVRTTNNANLTSTASALVLVDLVGPRKPPAGARLLYAPTVTGRLATAKFGADVGVPSVAFAPRNGSIIVAFAPFSSDVGSSVVAYSCSVGVAAKAVATYISILTASNETLAGLSPDELLTATEDNNFTATVFSPPQPVAPPTVVAASLLAAAPDGSSDLVFPLTLPASASVSLAPGVTFRLSVTAFAASGLSSSTYVDFAVDPTPPTPLFAKVGGGAKSLAVWGDRTRFSASWAFADVAGAASLQYQWSVCGGPVPANVSVTPAGAWWAGVALASCLFPPAGVDNATSASVGGLALKPGAQYAVVVVATNPAGLVASISSDPFTYDQSPPVAGKVLAKSGFVSSAQLLVATFEPWSDPQSPVATYEVALASRTGAADVLPWSAIPSSLLLADVVRSPGVSGSSQFVFSVSLADIPGANMTAANAALTMLVAVAASESASSGIPRNATVYIGVRGTTTAGLTSTSWSAPLALDTVAPSLDATCYDDTRVCGASAGVVGAPDPTDSPIFFTQASSVRADGSFVGPFAVVSGVQDPSLAAVVLAGASAGPSGLAYWLVSILVCETVTPADVLLGVPAVYACALADDSAPMRVSASAAVVPLMSMSPDQGTRIQVAATAVSGSGVTTSWTSPGYLVIDLAAPPPSDDPGTVGQSQKVSDGWGPGAFVPPSWPAAQTSLRGAEASYWPSASAAAVWWRLSDDDDGSGLVNFRVSLCPAEPVGAAVALPDSRCPVLWSNVGRRSTAAFGGLALAQMSRYRFWVSATDGAGLSTNFSSDGFVIDTTAPLLSANFVATITPSVVSDWRTLAITAAGAVDQESGIADFRICIDLSPAARPREGLAVSSAPGLPCTSVGVSLLIGATDPVTLGALLARNAAAAAAMDANLNFYKLRLITASRGASRDVAASLTVRVSAVNGAGLETFIALPPAVLTFVPLPIGAAFLHDASTWAGPGLSSPALVMAAGGRGDRGTTNSSFVGISWFGWGSSSSPVVAWYVSLGTRMCRSNTLPQQRVAERGAAGAFISGLRLVEFRRYYATVTAVDAGGLAATLCIKTPIALDRTRPFPGSASNVPLAYVRKGAVQRAEMWATVLGPREGPIFLTEPTVATAFTGFSDGQSFIEYIQVRHCPVADGSGCDAEWSERLPPLTVSVVSAEPSLEPGVAYVTEVRATDSGSNSISVKTRGFTYDPTPPTALSDVRATRPWVGSFAGLGARWAAFVDLESSMREYRICVGTPRFPCALLPFVSTGLNTSWAISQADASHVSAWASSDPMLDDGRRPLALTMIVMGINGAGLAENATTVTVQLDDTAPVAGTVEIVTLDAATAADTIAEASVGTGKDLAPHPTAAGVDVASLRVIEYQTTTQSLAFRVSRVYDREDPSELLSTFCIGTAPRTCDAVPARPFARVNPATLLDPVAARLAAAAPPDVNAPNNVDLVIVSHLSLVHGSTYYVMVTATNQAGLRTSMGSTGVTVDVTSPISTAAAAGRAA